MSISIALALFFICWWIALLALLPFRMGAEPPPPGSDPFAEAVGAPSNPNLKKKFILAAIISAFVVGALYAALAFELISLGEIRPALDRT
jgi:predicted secreted protein